MRSLLLRPGPYAPRQLSSSSTLFDYKKWSRSLQLLPHGIKLPPHAIGKEGRDIGTGEIVAFPSHLCRARDIVTITGFVQRHAHIFGEWYGAFMLDTLDDQLL